MNVLIVSGNITRDPEIQTTKSGMKVAHGTIAVQRERKTPDGEKITDFIDFSAFDKKAEYLQAYAHKGDRLEMRGRLESRKYTDRNNQERTAWELIVDSATAFSKKEDKPEAKPEETPKEERPTYADAAFDDLPF